MQYEDPFADDIFAVPVNRPNIAVEPASPPRPRQALLAGGAAGAAGAAAAADAFPRHLTELEYEDVINAFDAVADAGGGPAAALQQHMPNVRARLAAAPDHRPVGMLEWYWRTLLSYAHAGVPRGNVTPAQLARVQTIEDRRMAARAAAARQGGRRPYHRIAPCVGLSVVGQIAHVMAGLPYETTDLDILRALRAAGQAWSEVWHGRDDAVALQKIRQAFAHDRNDSTNAGRAPTLATYTSRPPHRRGLHARRPGLPPPPQRGGRGRGRGIAGAGAA